MHRAHKFNVPAFHYTKLGYTQYGEEMWSPRVCTFVGIVKWLDMATPTPIRSEASASHGRVDEDDNKATVLIPREACVKLNDRIDIFDETMLIIGVFPRRDVLGRMDHFECTLRRLEVPDSESDGDH